MELGQPEARLANQNLMLVGYCDIRGIKCSYCTLVVHENATTATL